MVTDFLTIDGGDARIDYRKRLDSYIASLSPEKMALFDALSRAVSSDDVVTLQALLTNAPASANELLVSGESAIGLAIRLDKPDALRILLQGEGVPDMPNPEDWPEGRRTYLDYARALIVPRSPALMALLSIQY